MSELKVIVVGAGRAGGDFHVPAFAAQPQTRVVGIVDPSREQAGARVSQYGLPASYDRLADALAQARPDIVSICSPPQFHLEQALQALAAGANVLLEKPMVLSLEEADRLADARARATGRLCVVHNYRFQPGVIAAVDMVRRGDVGRVLHVERTWLRNGEEDRMITDRDCWCYRMPGGRWTETVAHDLYIASQFVGDLKLVHVEARKLRDRWPWLVADEVSIILQAAAGYVSIRFSANVEDSVYKYTIIHGSKGTLVSDGVRTDKLPFKAPARPKAPPAPYISAPRQFINGTQALAAAVLRRVGVAAAQPAPSPAAAARPAPAPAAVDPLREPRGTGHLAVIEQFVAHVRGQAESPVTWEEAYATMKLVDAVGRGIESAARR